MKIVATLAASLLLAVPAFAQDKPAADKEADRAVVERIKAELRKRVPEAPVETVRRIPLAGLYEVVMGGEVFYTDEKAGYLVLGNIVNLATKENITDTRTKQLNRVNFSDLPLDSAIKIVRGNGSRKIAIFEDPNCGYCKRFERDLAGVNDITVYVFLYPILAESSVAKSKAIWCSADRGKAWLDTMVRDAPVSGEGACTTPIDKNLAFGQSKRIHGTPTIFFEDGDRVPGVMAMADFEKKLAAAKNAPQPRASNP
jgi:thiol:disulfide interchange protein DsbC